MSSKQEAVQAARKMLSEKILKDEVVDGSSFEVIRGDGHLIARISLKSVSVLSKIWRVIALHHRDFAHRLFDYHVLSFTTERT